MAARWRTGVVHVQSVVVEACWRPMLGDVGGDFHDVIDLRDGRVAVVIGDVVGYGPPAAAIADELSAQIRRAFRTPTGPAAVLGRLDGVLESAGEDKIATAVCVIVDLEAQRVRVANAGHLPLLVLNRDSVDVLDGPADFPLGVAADRREHERELEPDSALLLVTDGVIERRGTPLHTSIETLAGLCRGIGSADPWASEVARRATETFGQPSDDATVLCVRTDTRPAIADQPPAGPLPPAVLHAYVNPHDLRTAELLAVLDDTAARARGLDVRVEVVDINERSARTEEAGVLAAPTIIRSVPAPSVRVIGWFATADALARALQLPFQDLPDDTDEERV